MIICDVVFDLDGTLVDSAPDILEALRLAAAEAGIQSDAPLTTAVIGPPVREMLNAWGAEFSPQQADVAVKAFRRIYDSCAMTRTLPYAGVIQCLNELRDVGCRMFVATNKPMQPTRVILEQHFPALFQDFCCTDSIANQKLDKLGMLTALARKHAVEPTRVAIVGDSVSDLRAGKAFGCSTVAVLYGYGSPASLRAEHPDWEVDAPSDISRCIVAERRAISVP